MARIRTVKPEFFRHEELFEAEREFQLPLRVAFAGLWTAADREGRFRWSPRQLKLDCLPFDDVDFSRVLDALTTRGFIVKYKVENVEFGFIPSWSRHQVINNREKPSSLPEPNNNNTLTREARVNDASATPLKLTSGEGKGREGKEDAAPNGAHQGNSEEVELFRRGKNLLGSDSGGLIAKLLKSKKGSIPLARSAIEQASTKENPREYIGRVIRGPFSKTDPERHGPNDPYAGII